MDEDEVGSRRHDEENVGSRQWHTAGWWPMRQSSLVRVQRARCEEEEEEEEEEVRNGGGTKEEIVNLPLVSLPREVIQG